MSSKAAAAPPRASGAPESAERLQRLAVLLGTGALLLFMLALAVGASASADTWWHLATGRWILAHHAVPHADPFSFTAAGKPWVAHEYLSEILMYLVVRAAGWGGLALLQAALVTGAFWLVYRRSEGLPLIKAGAVLAALYAAQPGLLLRPQMFTLAGGAFFLWTLDKYQRQRRARLLVWLPVAMLLWVQLHGGFVLGLAILGVWITGALLDLFVRHGPEVLKAREIAPLGAALAVCAAVVPLNPNGFALYTHPFTIMHLRITRYVVEWMPPTWPEVRFRPFFLLLGLTLVVMVAGWRRYRAGQYLLFAAFSYEALIMRRNIPVFSLIAAPLLVQGIGTPELARRLGAGIAPPLRAALAAAALVAGALLASNQVNNEIAYQQQSATFTMPEQATKFLVENRLPMNLLNSYTFGGYLTWMLPPEYKVFIDGRADVFGDDFVENFVALKDGNVDPDPTLNVYGIRTIIMEPGSGLARVMREKVRNGSWRLVYEDHVAVIFTR